MRPQWSTVRKVHDDKFYTRRSECNKPSNEQKLEVEDFKGKRMRKEVADDQGREIEGHSLKKVQRSRQPSLRLRRQKNLADEHEDEAVKDNEDKNFDPKDDASDEDLGAPGRHEGYSILMMVPFEMPKSIITWIMSKVDVSNGTLEICGKSIAIKPLVPKIIGLPNGEKKVNLSKDIDSVTKKKFTNKGRRQNVVDTMKQMQTK
ncbi:hypothetical protein GUJ93_ZPchr0011g28328 [Zizania palustris]|uniref:Uncharacterized protein n=1 Tax=Zizania palustris TaxID=103762 RepID=A0A8J5WIC4_ZIZPA|nr:hypothetical protein GUJ93_ZPchr0011g28328 [Zizania palustris]